MSILATDVQHTGHLARHRVMRWIAIVFVAFVAAAALGSAGAWLGWRDTDPLPGDERARQVTAAIVPGARIGDIDRHDVIFGDRWPDLWTRLIGDDEYDGGYVVVTITWPDIGAVRATLRQSGWELLPHSGVYRSESADGPLSAEFLTARKDGLEVAVTQDPVLLSDAAPYGTAFGGEVVFQHPQPPLVRVLSLLGWGLGLLAGGWLALKFTARHQGRRPWNTPAWAGGALLALPSLATTQELFAPAAPIPPDVPGAPWEPYLVFKAVTIAGALCWAYALWLRRHHSR